MATAQDLIIRRRQRRSFNVVALLVLLALVIVIAGLVIGWLTRLDGRKDFVSSGAPNGTLSALKPTDVAGPDSSALRAPAVPQVDPTPQIVATTPVPAATSAPQRSDREPARTTSDAEDAGVRERDAQRRRAEQMRREEDARRQRLADAMRSMGGVAIADVSRDDEGQPQSDEQSRPNGRVLSIGTQIPVSLAQRLDSTFGGLFSVSVTDDVWDDRREHVAIPRKTTCYGNTTEGGVDGQARIYGEVDLCKLPDLTRLTLDKFPLADVDGATGLKARVDDHGAGRRNRGNAFTSMPSMLAGTLVPGIGGAVVSSAASAAQSSSVGRAVPGPTLYVDASPQQPRTFSILVTRDTALGDSQ